MFLGSVTMDINYDNKSNENKFCFGELRREYLKNDGSLATDVHTNIALVRLDEDRYIRYWDYLAGRVDNVLTTSPSMFNTWYVDKNSIVDSVASIIEQNTSNIKR